MGLESETNNKFFSIRVFSGGNPESWLDMMADDIYELQIPFAKQVSYASQFLCGIAQLWLQKNLYRILQMNWCDFSYAVLWEFGETLIAEDKKETQEEKAIINENCNQPLEVPVPSDLVEELGSTIDENEIELIVGDTSFVKSSTLPCYAEDSSTSKLFDEMSAVPHLNMACSSSNQAVIDTLCCLFKQSPCYVIFVLSFDPGIAPKRLCANKGMFSCNACAMTVVSNELVVIEKFSVESFSSGQTDTKWESAPAGEELMHRTVRKVQLDFVAVNEQNKSLDFKSVTYHFYILSYRDSGSFGVSRIVFLDSTLASAIKSALHMKSGHIIIQDILQGIQCYVPAFEWMSIAGDNGQQWDKDIVLICVKDPKSQPPDPFSQEVHLNVYASINCAFKEYIPRCYILILSDPITNPVILVPLFCCGIGNIDVGSFRAFFRDIFRKYTRLANAIVQIAMCSSQNVPVTSGYIILVDSWFYFPKLTSYEYLPSGYIVCSVWEELGHAPTGLVEIAGSIEKEQHSNNYSSVIFGGLGSESIILSESQYVVDIGIVVDKVQPFQLLCYTKLVSAILLWCLTDSTTTISSECGFFHVVRRVQWGSANAYLLPVQCSTPPWKIYLYDLSVDTVHGLYQTTIFGIIFLDTYNSHLEEEVFATYSSHSPLWKHFEEEGPWMLVSSRAWWKQFLSLSSVTVGKKVGANQFSAMLDDAQLPFTMFTFTSPTLDLYSSGFLYYTVFNTRSSIYAVTEELLYFYMVDIQKWSSLWMLWSNRRSGYICYFCA